MAKRLATYRADGDLLDAVAAKAARMGETVTAVIERAFREYVTDAPPKGMRGQRVKSGPPPSKPVPPPAPVRFRQPACDHRLPVGAYCKTCERTKT